MRLFFLKGQLLRAFASCVALVIGLSGTRAVAADSDAWNSPSPSVKKSTTKKKDRVAALDNGPDIYAPVPSSEIDFNRYQVPPSVKSALHVEATVSNWSPNQFTDLTYINTSGYKSDSGKISLNFWTGAWEMKGINLTPKFGFAYDQLLQTGQLPIYGQSVNTTEVMNLMSARFGLEVTPQSDFFGQLQPFANLSLLPTWADSPVSGVNDGLNEGFLSIEGELGLNWNIPHLGALLGVQKLGLEIGMEGTQGVLGSPLSGFGFLAGTRVEL